MSAPFSYIPPTHLLQKKADLTILQITDLHISTDFKNKKSFELTLNQALAEKKSCDLILLTGDLIDEMENSLYDYIFQVLAKTNIPFACISGNHDVTDEVGDGLPFYQKTLVAYPPDSRLLNQHVIETDNWQIILLDSSCSGKVSGWLEEEDLNWLKNQLINNHKHAIICLHHHVLPVESNWIDQHILLNADEFWEIIAPFKHVKSIVHGHIHQDYYQQFQGVEIFGTPSTCYQFKPKQFDFAFDSVPAGYRWLYLASDGTIRTELKRLN